MAIFSFFNWQDDDATKDLNKRRLGILQPGRYRGFDPVFMGGMNLRLNHETTGIEQTNFDDPAFTVQKRGVLFSKQGVEAQTTDNIDLVISPNSTSNPRIDLIVFEHKYVDVPGAAEANFMVEEGTADVIPEPPELSPLSQLKIIIGQLYIPAGTTSLTDEGVIYTQSEIPGLGGDGTIMHTNKVQTSVADKTFQSLKYVPVETKINNANRIDITEQGNIYIVNVNEGVPEGLDSYIPVIGLDNLTTGAVFTHDEGRIIYITSNYPIQLKDSASFVIPGYGFQRIDAGVVFSLKNEGGVWKLFKGGEAFQRAFNKYAGLQSWDSIDTPQEPDPVNNAINLPAKVHANTVVIGAGPSDSSVEIEKMHSASRFYQSDGSFVDSESGTLIFLEFQWVHTIKHGGGAPSDLVNKYKNFQTSNGSDITTKKGMVLMCLERPSHWQILGIYSNEFTILNEQIQTDWDELDPSSPAFLLNRPPVNCLMTNLGYVNVGSPGGHFDLELLTGVGIVSAQVIETVLFEYSVIRVTLPLSYEALKTALSVEIESLGFASTDTQDETKVAYVLKNIEDNRFDIVMRLTEVHIQDYRLRFNTISNIVA